MTLEDRIAYLEKQVSQIYEIIRNLQEGLSTKKMVNDLDLLRQGQIADLDQRLSVVEQTLNAIQTRLDSLGV